MAAGDIEGEISFFVVWIGGVDSDPGKDAVGRDHIQDIEIFNSRAGVAGMAIVTIVIAATNLNIGGIKRDDSFQFEFFDAILTAAATSAQNRCGLGWYNVAERPFHFSGESISRPLVHPL